MAKSFPLITIEIHLHLNLYQVIKLKIVSILFGKKYEDMYRDMVSEIEESFMCMRKDFTNVDIELRKQYTRIY